MLLMLLVCLLDLGVLLLLAPLHHLNAPVAEGETAEARQVNTRCQHL